HTAHGDVPTPAFMPVGTKATVKTVDPDELRAIGAPIVLANTYHLVFRPGTDVVEELGGLHAFMGWDGPILTDSGGFQVFSLRHTILAADDRGVTFRSVYDGSPARFTPEGVAGAQRALGSDIAMCLDVCPPAGAPRGEVDAAVARTTTWARRQREAPRAPGQLLFGISQGGVDPALRARSIDEITALGFDGYAVGGLSVGEERELTWEAVGQAALLLPATQPRYFMGLGDPQGILEVIERGIDMFDCVLPTRLGRTGTALTAEGRLNLKNAGFVRDPRPLEEQCSCNSCQRFSRAYVRHLVNQNEVLGLRLLTIHNLHYLQQLTAGARTAIEGGELASFKAETLGRLRASSEEAA
ncbi:MAG: tRNA guanosine(34) transglycosylase Tgt, partial [Gaiellaceae bacterium]